MRKHHRQLDLSVERSGPHDFAVRCIVTRQLTTTRPSHPAPQIVTIAKRPSFIGRGMARAYRDDLPDGWSEIFLRERVDSRISVEFVCKNSIFGAFGSWWDKPRTPLRCPLCVESGAFAMWQRTDAKGQ
jgi:hypothetical protein